MGTRLAEFVGGRFPIGLKISQNSLRLYASPRADYADGTPAQCESEPILTGSRKLIREDVIRHNDNCALLLQELRA